MKIDKITPVSDSMQLLNVTITYGDNVYAYEMNAPILEGGTLQEYCDSQEYKHLNNILYQVYNRKMQFSSGEEWDEWIDDGCIIPEVTKEVSHPAIEAKDAVYKQDVLVAAVEAQDAVMGSRQKEIVTEEEKEVSNTDIVEEDGKYIQKVTTETVTTENKELQWEEVPLYNEDGDEVIGAHKIPLMEEYEVTPAVEAVEEVLSEKYLVSEAVGLFIPRVLSILPFLQPVLIILSNNTALCSHIITYQQLFSTSSLP